MRIKWLRRRRRRAPFSFSGSSLTPREVAFHHLPYSGASRQWSEGCSAWRCRCLVLRRRRS